MKCPLSTGTVLNMNDINNEYVSMLCENGVNPGVPHFKLHLKHLIAENVRDVEFVWLCRMNESEHVVNSRNLAVAVDNMIPLESEEVLNDVPSCNLHSTHTRSTEATNVLNVKSDIHVQ